MYVLRLEEETGDFFSLILDEQALEYVPVSCPRKLMNSARLIRNYQR